MNANFWNRLDQLVASSHVTIDRPRGSIHPRFADIIYPLDYGFLENTTAADKAGIDVFVGSLEPLVTGAIMTVDLQKRDAEMKILLGCSSAEMRVVHEFMNSQTFGGALLMREAMIDVNLEFEDLVAEPSESAQNISPRLAQLLKHAKPATAEQLERVWTSWTPEELAADDQYWLERDREKELMRDRYVERSQAEVLE